MSTLCLLCKDIVNIFAKVTEPASEEECREELQKLLEEHKRLFTLFAKVTELQEILEDHDWIKQGVNTSDMHLK